MRITEARILPVTIPRLKELKVAYATRTVYQGFLLQLGTDSGLTGLGEASPNFEVCHEDLEGTAAALAAMAPLARGADPLEREAVLARLEPWRKAHASALTAFDTALWDLAGKAAGLPVRDLIGGYRRDIANAMTIGILPLDQTVAEARSILASGRFAEIKLKLGLDPDLDVARVRAVRAAVGPDFPLHVDANQGYDRQTALAVLTRLAPERIEFAEQPVPAGDVEALAWVNRRSPIPVMADEAVRTPEDALALVRAGACSRLNVKLQKVGGISRALDVLAIARAAGLPCLIGCMTETLVGITAGAHLALASPVVANVDLDGHVDLAFQPVAGGLRVDGDRLALAGGPGLGLELTAEWRERFAATAPAS
ncbi:MAG: dipeptide epimerase [Holophaga sp.]|jgi:L-alanine-DL-glutamate epimerase-like enolase superfamily enzyme